MPRSTIPPETEDALPRAARAATQWWNTRMLLRRLGSENDDEREVTIALFVARGAASWPDLHRALHEAAGTACGAAVALWRMGEADGVHTALRRCYEEEWLLRGVRDGRTEALRAVRWLGRDAVGSALCLHLERAEAEARLHPCLDHLGIALSALRILTVFPPAAPCDWWERALRFGRGSLHKLSDSTLRALAWNLTDWVRSAGLRGLLAEHPGAALAIFLAALEAKDVSVQQTALNGLLRLGDRRALPALQALAFSPRHPLCAQARAAIERLAGPVSDPLTLLRSASPLGEYLLRPANSASSRSDALLRPAASSIEVTI